MKTIELTQGKVTVVDDDVYEWASKFKWHAHAGNNTFYAARKPYRKSGKRITIFLHREILPPSKGKEVDHRDGNGLNNLRGNLREATHQQNMMAHQSKHSGQSSRFRGVTRDVARQAWAAQIQISGKHIMLGRFCKEEDAARAYDAKARELFGEYASPNFSVGL